MIKSIKTKFSRNLLLLISFALLLFMSACGGTLDSATGDTSKGSISISSSSASLAAGESSIITATVLDGTGSAAQGRTVTFTLLSNKSGATITALNGGETDSSGQAIATYTAGSSNPNAAVEDSIQVSTSGATNVILITRASSSSTAYRLSLTADSVSLTAGTTTIIRATVTDSSGKTVSGQAVTFTLLQNNSGATLTTLSLGTTDTSGQALAIYSAGSSSPTLTVQDTIQASITGATGVVIITRTPSTASATGLSMTLTADATSLTAGNSTLIRATVKGSTGPAVGQTVSFSFLSNNSGGTLTVLNGGQTDANGQAIATYTAGSNTPTLTVQDTIQASLTGTVGAIIITRTSGGGTSAGLLLTLTADKTTVDAGQSTIITAKVTNGTGSPVQGETVTFGFAPGGNNSGAAITVLSSTTDAAGIATALYAAGSLTGATVQDIVQASITGSTKAIIITKTGTASGVTASSIDLSASPSWVNSDGSTTSTITVTSLNSLNAAISGVTVTMSSVGPDHGVLSAATVITPGTVTFSCGPNKANRTATVTGTSGSISAQIPIQIKGSTITVTSDASSISAPTPATSTNLTVTLKDAGNNVVSGSAVTLTQAPTGGIGSGSVTLGSTSGTTDSSGVFTTTATGLTVGSVTITATALGTQGTTPLMVTTTGAAFGIENQYLDGSGTPIAGNPDPTALSINSSGTPYTPHSLKILVNAPGVTTVRFATTIGGWNSTTNKVVDVAVGTTGDGATKVSATLTSTYMGVANVQVSDAAHLTTVSDTLTVAMGSGEVPNKIVLQATPTVVPISVGTTSGSSTLTATVYDASNNPLGGQTVAFSIVDGTSTSGGETITKVLVQTATISSGGLSVGQARTQFNSGSMPSSGMGVQIHASVVGYPGVKTGTSPSGNDVAIVIGGVAGSISFGEDSKAAQDDTNANYLYKMSVLVADANGNPVSGAVVNLGVWPIAWCTGSACTCDPDTATSGTFYNEDANENLFLDAGEDGARRYYYAHIPTSVVGTPDHLMTPVNSFGGTVPASKITDVNGVAGFTLTYPKTSGMWIYDRIRATTIVQGTETRAEIILYLKIVIGEEVICAESPFKF